MELRNSGIFKRFFMPPYKLVSPSLDTNSDTLARPMSRRVDIQKKMNFIA